MYEDACRVLRFCTVPVVGFGDEIRPQFHGRGCLIGPAHVLTALHVVELIRRNYKSLAVGKHDGLFSADIVYSDSSSDIAVLKVGELVEPLNQEPPALYPTISERVPEIGMAVGHLSILNKQYEGTGKRFAGMFFSAGHVAFMLRVPELRWAIVGGFCESGFSGSPAFLPDGSLIGVIVETTQTMADSAQAVPQAFTFPVISALAPMRAKILTACVA